MFKQLYLLHDSCFGLTASSGADRIITRKYSKQNGYLCYCNRLIAMLDDVGCIQTEPDV